MRQYLRMILPCNLRCAVSRNALAVVLATSFTFANSTTCAAEVEAPYPLALHDVVTIARTRGLDVLLAEANIRGAQGDERAAGAIPNPALGVTYGRTFYVNEGQRRYGRDNDITLNSYTVGISDQAALSDSLSGKRGLRKEVAQAALKAARMARQDAERVLVGAVKSQYIQIALSEQVLEFMIETANSTTQTRELVSSRFRAGAVSEADVARAEAAKLEADQAVDSARGSLRTQQASMAFLLGVRGVAPNYDVESNILEYREPAQLANIDAQRLLQLAQLNRPDLKTAEFQEQQARAALALARRQRFPDIALSVSYTQLGSGVAPEQPPSVSVGVSAPIPVFYQYQGEVTRANAMVEAQSIQRTRLYAQVASEVALDWSAYSTARTRVLRMQNELLRQVENALKLVTIQYEKGSASLLELLDARRTYNAVNLEYRQDLADYWSALVQLELAVGMELIK